METLYVVGHVNPDTDSIASAIGYAWLLKERDGIDAIPARSGAMNQQAAWVLKHMGLEIPLLVTDASPKFVVVMRRLDTTSPEKPLREAWSIASRTGGIAPVINQDGTPYGLITGRSLFEYLTKLIGPRLKKQEIHISEILDTECKDAADTKVAQFQANSKIRDSLNRVLREEGDEFWVVDENKRYLGICRQRDLLNPPRLRVVLVDHNEASQSIANLEEADLIEILDHHRLGNPSTHLPIRFTVDIVGSTSTLVSERIEDAGLSAPPKIAGVLLAGLLSDTLSLTSPTTTERDRLASDRLVRWAGSAGGPLENDTISNFGQKVLSASSGLSNRDAKDVVRADQKVYTGGGFEFAIAQAEVNNLYEITDRLEELKKALGELAENKGLDFSMLMITDIVRGSSRLIIHNSPPVLDGLPYLPEPDGTLMAEGVVSRKKQLLPVVLGLLER